MRLETVIIGKPTPTRLVFAIWLSDELDCRSDLILRYRAEGELTWREAQGEFFGNRSQRDHCHVHFWLKDLRPDTVYEYEIMHTGHALGFAPARGQSAHDQPSELRVRTPPEPGSDGAKRPVTLLFGGDQEATRLVHDRSEVTARLYRHMARQNAAFFVHGADVFLNELPAHVIGYVKATDSFRRALHRDFASTCRGYLSRMPSFRVLDDHDFASNSVHGDAIAENRALAQQVQNAIFAFNELWPVRNGPVGDGLYYQVSWGDIDLWFLQCRVYATKEPQPTLLGRMQKDWLSATLRASRASIKLIVTALPFAYGKEAAEDFRGTPREWRELLTTFAETGVTAILTADSHNYSRVDLVVPRADGSEAVIPQFLVGTMGGRPQHDSRDLTRMPDDAGGIRVIPRTYYSAHLPGEREYYGYMSMRISPMEGRVETALHRVGVDRDAEFEVFDAYTFAAGERPAGAGGILAGVEISGSTKLD